ncbi:porin family protein [Hymenobacter sp. ASUV-10]|uniref:Porin family protein n=1 Tax=Hymenobacter aranciens TaxID=3063996 RepID=A0ABT9BEZ7_9BACT|nr:porin family protein [Hymenobacter sp. ASUV-10]MDO7876817.1 porin family protein [Hymenobacter sp. ASUV-10]
MKKVLLSLGLLAGISATAQAQATFGVKAGATLTNFMGDDVSDDSDNKVGFLVGAVANFAVNDMFSIQPEVLFSQKGAQGKESGETVKLNQNYVDVPVMVKVNTGDNGSGLFFELGPQFGLLVSSKAEDTDTKEAFNTFDFGYAAGLGYQLESGLNFGLRYNGGITNVYKEVDVLGTSVQAKARNSAFQLSVGYMFGGK